MKEVYNVRFYVDNSKELETLFFERDIDAFVFLEKHGYEFDTEAENHFTFDRAINGIREWAVVERKSVIPKQPIPFKFGDKIKFKQYAIDSGTFPDSIKEGFMATVMGVEEENVLLHVGSGLNILRVIPIEDMHEGWFELVESANTEKLKHEEREMMNKLFIGNDINDNPIYEGDKVAIVNLTDTLSALGDYEIGDKFEAIKKGDEVYRASRRISLDTKHCMLIKENHITPDVK